VTTSSQARLLHAQLADLRAKARAAELDAARFSREAADLAQVLARIEERATMDVDTNLGNAQ
jgi:hypothetical protein